VHTAQASFMTVNSHARHAPAVSRNTRLMGHIDLAQSLRTAGTRSIACQFTEGGRVDSLISAEFQLAVREFISSTDCLGYIACGLVLVTFCMQAMVPLRLVALVSNVAFITYGWAAKLFPILMLHILLAVINLTSLYKTLVAVESSTSERVALSKHLQPPSSPAE
jgi:hypothetical protein